MRSRLVFPIFLGAALMLGPTLAAVPPAATLDVADVAYLWPVATAKADVEALVSCSTPTADGSPLLPAAAFDSILREAANISIQDRAGRSIGITFDSFFEARLKDAVNWKIVGFRFDPEAVGHEETLKDFGVMPQLRLIAQPVTVDANGRVRVHDLAAHLVFGYFTGPRPFKADRAKLAEVLQDLGDLKTASPVPTGGPLGVHPGLKTKDAAFLAKVKAFLAKWTSPSKGSLAAISFMGIDTPEPWIFFALGPGDGGRFVPAPQSTLRGKHAQMISFRGAVEIEPRSTAVHNSAAGKTISTAPLFDDDLSTRLDEPAEAGLPQPLRKDIPDFIANPKFAHVFNTDCVSCHTETTRREELGLSGHAGAFRYVRPAGISGVDPAVVPRDRWNVRNFGWFRQNATITHRAANEIAESVAAIRRLEAAPPPPSGAPQAQLLRVSFRSEPRREPRAAAPVQPASTPAPAAKAPVPVATPLTLVMEAKSPQDMQALKALVAGMQAKPPDQNPIRVALNALRIVHYARFVFLDDRHLAIITTFDGSFEDYIDAFVNTIGNVFNQLMTHVKDAPLLPVQEHREAFLAYVKAHDKGAVQPFYSAYPDLTVGEILTLQHEAAQKRASQR